MGIGECKVWFGGVSRDVIASMRPKEVADDLAGFGSVQRVEMKDRYFVVTMASTREADRIIKKRRVHVCGHICHCENYVTVKAMPPMVRQAEGARKGNGKLSVDAEDLLQSLREKKELSQELSLRAIEDRLRELSHPLQVAAIEKYIDSMSSNPQDVRNPMGWFSSIIRTLAMGLDHSGKARLAGYNREKLPGPSVELRQDMQSPRTMARRDRGRRRSESPRRIQSTPKETGRPHSHSTRTKRSKASKKLSQGRSPRKRKRGRKDSSDGWASVSEKDRELATKDEALDGWESASEDKKKEDNRKLASKDDALDGWESLSEGKAKSSRKPGKDNWESASNSQKKNRSRVTFQFKDNKLPKSLEALHGWKSVSESPMNKRSAKRSQPESKRKASEARQESDKSVVRSRSLTRTQSLTESRSRSVLSRSRSRSVSSEKRVVFQRSRTPAAASDKSAARSPTCVAKSPRQPEHHTHAGRMAEKSPIRRRRADHPRVDTMGSESLGISPGLREASRSNRTRIDSESKCLSQDAAISPFEDIPEQQSRKSGDPATADIVSSDGSSPAVFSRSKDPTPCSHSLDADDFLPKLESIAEADAKKKLGIRLVSKQAVAAKNAVASQKALAVQQAKEIKRTVATQVKKGGVPKKTLPYRHAVEPKATVAMNAPKQAARQTAKAAKAKQAAAELRLVAKREAFKKAKLAAKLAALGETSQPAPTKPSVGTSAHLTLAGRKRPRDDTNQRIKDALAQISAPKVAKITARALTSLVSPSTRALSGSAACPKEKKTTKNTLVSLLLRAPNGKVKHVMHRAEATIREILQAHGKDPLEYRFLFEGHRVSREVTVKELKDSMPIGRGKEILTLCLEKLIRVEIYLGNEIFEEQLPGNMTVADLFEDLRVRGLENDTNSLCCQNKEGIEYAPDLTLSTLDSRSSNSRKKGKPLKLHILRAEWDSD